MTLRRLLILIHRYLGIAISLMCVVWFASGIVMIYAGSMPRLSQDTRLERMPALDLYKVRLSPADAVERLGGAAGRVVLLTVMERPAYRIQGRGSPTIFADDGVILQDIDLETSRVVASRFVAQPPERVLFVRTLDQQDQWTLTNREFPIHKFRVDDAAGTEIYVSPHLAEVALVTTRSERVLAWIGAIPHWIYFTALRTNAPLWSRVVVWLSGLACVLTVLGLILAFTQFRRVRPFRLSAAIPYRGWMRWHYILGAIFGVFALTWAFSGLLSMEPFEWTNAQGLEMRRDVLSGGAPQLNTFAAPEPGKFGQLAVGRSIREISFTQIQDASYYTVSVTGKSRVEAEQLLIDAKTLDVRREPFSVESIVKRLAAAAPNVPIVEQTLLSEYDSYYYSRGGEAPLPVLRVKFGDPAQTWFYVDPQASEMVGSLHRLSRLERWLYNGLHSLDFKFWYSRRPLWDIGMIVLLLGGLALSGIGLYLGVKRLVRDLAGHKQNSSQAPGTNTL